MELDNATRLVAAYTLAVDKDAREHLVVAVKGTFAFPERPGEPAELAEAQVPLVLADAFGGEPGLSAPLYEMDFALTKPRCDVLLQGTAHAPGGRPVDRVQVGVKLGDWRKTFHVVGDRVWRPAGATFGPGAPAPFTTMPVSYDRAYGGVDDADPDPARHDTFLPNPVGRGYHQVRTGALIDGRPLPNTEAIDDPVRLPWGGYRPMALGPIGRGWAPRYKLAGTYDQAWIDNVFPFLPRDFDDRYHQAAPEDQQIAPPQGGEELVLLNLTQGGRAHLRLPPVELPVVFIPRAGAFEPVRAVVDTVVIEPDQGRLMLTWRASRPLRNDVFELRRVVVGHRSRAWWRAQVTGKVYHPSLGAAVGGGRRP